MNNHRRGWIGSVLLLLAATLPVRGEAADAAAPSAATEASTPAAVIRLSGEIDDYTRDALFRRFTRARANGAKTIILQIDTYGGLVSSGLDISRFLKRQNDLHTIAYVKDKAISAGAMIALACDEIVMSPESVLGDCAPIQLDDSHNLKFIPAAERAKIETPIVQDFKDSARRNGYSPAVVEAMVSVEKTVYLVRNDAGETRAAEESELPALSASGWKPSPGVKQPVDGPNSLLTVGPEMAGLLGLSKGIASSAEALASSRNLAVAANLGPGFGEDLIKLLNSNVVRFVLLIIFLQSLYIALHIPGHGAPEAVATVALGLLIGIPLLTGYAQWWEIAVIFVGLSLCAFEIFVFPGHLVSLAVGGLMVILGLVTTFVGREPAGMPGWLPTLEGSWRAFQNGLIIVLGAILGSVFLSMWVKRFLPRLPYFNRLILTTTTGNTTTLAGAGTGVTGPPESWPFIGTIGRALTDLRPGGSAEFPYADVSRSIAVVSRSGYILAGAKVVVEEARGSRIFVRALPGNVV